MRMRELHDGIELLNKERDDGPFVWQTWDKWVKRCEEVISRLDQQLSSAEQVRPKSAPEVWKNRGFICGVEWTAFKKIVYEYRQKVKEYYGGMAGIRQHLVFAHNDVGRKVIIYWIFRLCRPDTIRKCPSIRAIWNVTFIAAGQRAQTVSGD